MKGRAKILPKLVSSPSIAALAGMCLLTLAWFAIFPLASCLQCEIQAVWKELHSWYESSIPYAVRPWVGLIFREVPTTIFNAFLDPYLYIVVAVIALLEQLLPVETGRRFLSTGTIQDIFWFGMHKVFEVALISVTINALRWVYDSYLSFLTIHIADSWPQGLRITLVIFVNDFLDWFHHLIRHKVWFLWCFHSVHHSQREMNMFTDERVHPADEIIANSLIFVPMFMLSIGTPLALYLALTLKWFPKLHHANVKTNLGWLRYVFVTPQSHRVHHSIEERHRDRNFGVIFSIWDRLFGTLYSHYNEYPVTGVPDTRFPYERETGWYALMKNYVSQMLYPFKMILHRLRA